MLAIALTPAIALSLFQLIAYGCIITFAFTLGLILGIWEGRAREAAEPSQRLAEDDARGIGGGHG